MSKKPELTTSKMTKETEQQYTAWLLYCETGSLQKTLDVWERVGQSLDETWMHFAQKLGKKPSHTTIGNWSKKYRWVERRELKLEEDIATLYKKAQEYRRKKIGYIAEIFWEKLQALRKQMKKGEGATVGELKQVWEMFRTELGESIGRHDFNINEDEQKPLTPEEDELGEQIDATIKSFYERKRKGRKN